MPSRRRSAFSLIEVIVVMGVMGVLIGFTMSAVQSARAAANRAACGSNLRQLGVALHGFHQTYLRLPPAVASQRPFRADAVNPHWLLGWMVTILPHVEQEALYRTAVDACAITTNTLQNPPHTGLTAVVPVFTCPADWRLGVARTNEYDITASYASYLGNAGSYSKKLAKGYRGMLGDSPGCRFGDVSDGLSHTLMVAERPPPNSFQAGMWYSVYWHQQNGFLGPNNIIVIGAETGIGGRDGCADPPWSFGPGDLNNPCDRHHLWSLHAGGGNFMFGDGSVRFFGFSINSELVALASRDCCEPVVLPD